MLLFELLVFFSVNDLVGYSSERQCKHLTSETVKTTNRRMIGKTDIRLNRLGW